MKKIILLLFSLFAIGASAQLSNGIAKGTIVTLADGSEISIEEVRKDDLLLTLKDDQSAVMVSRAVNIEQAAATKLVKITLANGMQILLTEDQILLSDKGWVAFDGNRAKKLEDYISANVSSYQIDSFIYTLNPNLKMEVLPIIEIERISENTPIYKLTLDSPTAYIANGIFVGQ